MRGAGFTNMSRGIIVAAKGGEDPQVFNALGKTGWSSASSELADVPANTQVIEDAELPEALMAQLSAAV